MPQANLDSGESAGGGLVGGRGAALTGVGVRGELDAYCYGRGLLERVGWEIYLGRDQGQERWEKIARVRIAGDKVRITAADGVTYVTGYVDAVRCRRPS
jgi:hypothetical protein